MDAHHITSADVIVLGAGISGLACAAQLRTAGCRVIVLEARQRPGGRLHTISMSNGPGCPSYAMDLGAAWVHGIGSAGAPNHLYRMACELHLGCRPTDYTDAAVYTADGLRLAESTVADMEHLYHGFEQYLQALLHAPDPRGALVPIQTALDDFAASRGLLYDQTERLAFAVSNHMEHYWAGEARCMGVAALDEVVLPGGDVVLTEGYGGIVAALAAGLDVRLGHEVIAVEYDSSCVAVTVRVAAAAGEAGAGSIREGRVTFRAAAAVVTLPVGVLRSGSVEFTPPLRVVDPAKAAAIGKLGVAVYNKVVMVFDHSDVFWDNTAFIYRIPAPGEGGRWSYFLNMHKVAGAPALVAFNLGEAALQLETISDEAAVESALVALAGIYGAARVRRPRRAAVTRWGSEPYSRMSYTYVPAGLTTAAFDDLARPVLGRLYFAGEATHRRHYGTAHGAYESGILAAADIWHQLQQQQMEVGCSLSSTVKWPVGTAASEQVPLQRVGRTTPRPLRWRALKPTRASHVSDGVISSGSLILAPTGGGPDAAGSEAGSRVGGCSGLVGLHPAAADVRVHCDEGGGDSASDKGRSSDTRGVPCGAAARADAADEAGDGADVCADVDGGGCVSRSGSSGVPYGGFLSRL